MNSSLVKVRRRRILFNDCVLHLDLGLYGGFVWFMRPFPYSLKGWNRLDPGNHISERCNKMSSPHLAVGHDVDARLLLKSNCLVNGTILDALEVARAEPATFPFLSRFLKVSRP